MSTPTPRTDAEASDWSEISIYDRDACVPASFARTLERDLAAAQLLLKVESDAVTEQGKTISSLQADLAAARAEVERLKEDTARLDWLAKGDTYGKLSSVRLSLPTAFYPTPIAHDCIRAAIDAARAKGAT
jgi:multidrug resistance efflux pump